MANKLNVENGVLKYDSYTVWHSGNLNPASADSSFVVGNQASYVAVRLPETIASFLKDKYLEFWQSSCGWMNIRCGYMVSQGVIQTLSGYDILSSANIKATSAIHAGTFLYANNGYVQTTYNGLSTKLGSLNSSFFHVSTDAPAVHVNKPLHVTGNIYGGDKYDRRLAYVDEIPSTSGFMPLTGGTFTGDVTFNTTANFNQPLNSIYGAAIGGMKMQYASYQGGSTVGWLRVARVMTSGAGACGMLFISSSYNSPMPSPMIIAYNTRYDGLRMTINKICGTAGGTFSEARIVYDPSTRDGYLELYYNSTYSNSLYFQLIPFDTLYYNSTALLYTTRTTGDLPSGWTSSDVLTMDRHDGFVTNSNLYVRKKSYFGNPLIIKSTIGNQYDDGIRIGLSPDNWAGISLGAEGETGITGGWWIGRNPNKQLVIAWQTASSGNGLTLPPDSSRPTWMGTGLAYVTDIPTALKSPQALTFTGAVTGSYDGSTAKTVNIPSPTTSLAWTSITGKPLDGSDASGAKNCNDVVTNGLYYYNGDGPTTAQGASTTDGALYAQAYSSSWVGQIAQDYRNGNLFVRGKNNGTWTAWKKVATTDLIPTSLKSPYAITFTGGVTGTYDGSAAKTVAIPVINKANVVAALNQSGTNTITQYCDFTAGAGNSGSDTRYKKNVEPVTSILDDLLDIDIITYDWDKEGERAFHTVGIKAQQLLDTKNDVLTRIVHERSDTDDTLYVDYDRVGVLALQGLQELNKKLMTIIEKQASDIKRLKSKLGII